MPEAENLSALFEFLAAAISTLANSPNINPTSNGTHQNLTHSVGLRSMDLSTVHVYVIPMTGDLWNRLGSAGLALDLNTNMP